MFCTYGKCLLSQSQMSQSPKIDEPNSEQLNSWTVSVCALGNGYNIFIYYTPYGCSLAKTVRTVRSVFHTKECLVRWQKVSWSLGETMALSRRNYGIQCFLTFRGCSVNRFLHATAPQIWPCQKKVVTLHCVKRFGDLGWQHP